MAVSYATITGRVTFPGSDAGLPGLVTAVPLTRAAGLVIAGDRLTQGVVSAPVDADGNLPVGGLKVPIVSVSGTPVLWRLVFEPASVTARSEIGNKGLLPWQFYIGPITASATVQALATMEPTAILANFPPTLVAQAQQAATDAATSAAAAAAVGATSDAQQANNTTNGPLTKAALSASFARTVDPADNGYDVIIAAGQSNMSGYATDYDTVRYDAPHPRVFQWGSNGPYANTIAIASEPLLMHDVAIGMGPALVFARWYADTLPGNRRVLLVPTAHAGTSFENDPLFTWKPGGNALGSPTNLYEFTIAQAKAALIAAGKNARFAGVLWHQGEFDAGIGQSAYATDLDLLIDGFRSRIPGATDSWFVAGQMVPDGIAVSVPKQQINAAHVDTPRRKLLSGFGYGISGATIDNLHYIARGQRALGRTMFEAYARARVNVLGAAPLDPPAIYFTQAGTSLTISWDRPAGRATDFTVQYRPGTSGSWTTVTRTVPNLDSAGTTIIGLVAGTAYQVRVLTTNESGVSAGTPQTYTMLRTPNPITGLTAGAGTSSVQPLTWTAPAVDGTHDAAAAYLVEFKKTSDSTWTVFGSVTTPASSVNGLQAGTAYDYRVTAGNPAGLAAAVGISATTAATSPLLDAVTAPAYWAVGTRKLKATATKAIRVRRSSDNTEQDIAFVGNDLDTAALLTFCGAGNGFIKTFYDQSGNARDFVAPSNAAQAQIVTAGALVTVNSKASSTWAASAYSLASAGLYAATTVTAIGVVKAAAPGSSQGLMVELNAADGTQTYQPVKPINTTGNAGYLLQTVGNTVSANGATPALYNATLNQFSVTDTGSTNTRWVNGTLVQTSAYSRPAGTLAPDKTVLGAIFNGTIYGSNLAGNLSEFVAFASVLSTAERQAAEANQKNYYATA